MPGLMAEENEREIKRGLQVRKRTNTHLCESDSKVPSPFSAVTLPREVLALGVC